MSKRRNENGQMRREDYEAADDRDGDSDGGGLDGGFQRAPREAIARRKIVTARVSAKRPAPAPTAAPTAPASKPNAFAGFSGLASAEPPARANPFAGFNGLASSAPTPAPVSFGVAAAPAPARATASASTSKSAPTSYQEAIEVLNKEFLDFVTQQLQKNPSADWSAAVNDYAKHAQEIGSEFVSTKPVAGAAARSAPTASVPIRSFTPAPPSTKNDQLSVASGFSFDAKRDSPAAPKNAGNGFSFCAIPAASSVVSTPAPVALDAKEKDAAQPPTASVLSFASRPAEDKPTPAFSFGPPKTVDAAAPKPATGGFSFGAAPSTAAPAASTGGFSFGAAKPAASAPSSGGFSFSLSAPAAAGSSAPAAPSSFALGSSAPAAAGAAEGAPADEDEENIGREEATVILKSNNPDEECLFEVEKAKVIEFKKDEKRWADKGTHPLKVLINKSTKNARILVRNEIGKIVLNSALYKGLAVKPHEAKGKKTGAQLALQVDAAITQFILKVNGEKVDAFLAALESATPK